MFTSQFKLKSMSVFCALFLATLASAELAIGQGNSRRSTFPLAARGKLPQPLAGSNDLQVAHVRLHDSMKWNPPRTNGDSEFDGNGPHVAVAVQFFTEANVVYRSVWMRATESDDTSNTIFPDKKTEAKGWSPRKAVWRAPADKVIVRIDGPLEMKLIDTRLSGKGAHQFSTPVGMATVWGDRLGHDVGYTGVEIKFDYGMKVVIRDGGRPDREEVQFPRHIELRTKLIRGDAEFDGNGPKVTVNAGLITSDTRIMLVVNMTAKETKADWTTAEGSVSKVLYVAPPGRRIKSISGKTMWKNIVRYVDKDHKMDRFITELGIFYVRGDHKGEDLPYHTGLTLQSYYTFVVETEPF